MLFQPREAVKTSPFLSRDLKKQLYTILIRSIVTYGTETWAIRKTDDNRLLIFERKTLRRIFGPVKNNIKINKFNVWRIRKNKELESLFQKLNNEEIRHAWKNPNPLQRMVLEKNLTGEGPIGRPSMRWEEE